MQGLSTDLWPSNRVLDWGKVNAGCRRAKNVADVRSSFFAGQSSCDTDRLKHDAMIISTPIIHASP